MLVDVSHIQAVISLLSFLGMIILAFINLRLKSEQQRGRLDQEQLRSQILDRMEQLKQEVTRQFVPLSVDVLQHTTIQQRMESAEREIARNRDSIHLMNNKFTELILGRLDAMKNQMDDQSRRIGAIQDKLDSQDVMLHDFARRVDRLERN